MITNSSWIFTANKSASSYLKVSIQASLSSIVKTENTMNFLMKGQATLFGNTSFALNLPEYYKTWVTQACNSVSLPVQVAIIA